MSTKTTTAIAIASLAIASQLNGSTAFAPVAFTSGSSGVALRSEEPKSAEAAVFLPNESTPEDASDESPKEEAIGLDKVEMLGRGAAKVRLSNSPRIGKSRRNR